MTKDILERLTDYHRGCTSEMRQEAADLIEKQEQEIERLRKENARLKEDLAKWIIRSSSHD